MARIRGRPPSAAVALASVTVPVFVPATPAAGTGVVPPSGPAGRALAVLVVAGVAAEALRRYAPDAAAATVDRVRADPGDSFLAGTLVVGGGGFGLAVYALSVVGLGAALPAVAAYCLLLGGAAGVGALAVGNAVLEQVGVGVVGAGSPLSVAVGSGAFALAGAVPVAGLCVVAAVTLAGVGAVATRHLDGRRRAP